MPDSANNQNFWNHSLELWDSYRLAHPLWLAALLAVLLILFLRARRRVPVLLIPFAADWYRPSIRSSSPVPVVFAVAGLIFLSLALARPQRVEDKREVRSQGYDLMLAIDLSSSMLAEDFERNNRPLNRLQAIKPVIQAFINDRPNDRIGMVVFSGRAYTLAPLTFDHDWLARQTEMLRLGMIEDGTAIGDGLGVALSRLEQARREDGNQRKGAFVILLTDGANNRGLMTPPQAAEIAKSRGIPVYAIGAGKTGWVPFPVFDGSGRRIDTTRRFSDLDEGALRELANSTGGRYFKVDDVRTVEQAFAAIDRSQKIEFQAKSYLVTTEFFHWPAIAGGILLLLGSALSWTASRRSNPAAANSPVEAAPRPASHA